MKVKDVQVDVVGENYAIPCGTPVGIYLKSNGILVIGTGTLTGADGMSIEPAYGILRSGDYIEAINGRPLSKKEELVEAARSNAFSCIFLEGQEIYVNFADLPTKNMMKELDLPIPPVSDPSRALEGELFQALAFLTKDRESLLLDQAPHLKTTRWHPSFLDVIPATGGKDHGMDAILEHFHIPLEESMAFGDGENDLTMLRHAGVGVAMGSASEVVKAGAGYITGSVEEDGIVSALKHFALL